MTTWFLHTKFAYILIFCNVCILLDEEYDKLNIDFDIVRIDEVSGPKAQIYSIIYEGEDEQMRLYCLRYDNTCIFVGSGGYKPPNVRAYQEHKPLDEKAQEMKRIAACINKAIRDKDFKIMDDGTLDISEFIELKI